MDASTEQNEQSKRARGRDLACEAVLRTRFAERPTSAGSKALDQLRSGEAELADARERLKIASRRIKWSLGVAAAAAVLAIAFGLSLFANRNPARSDLVVDAGDTPNLSSKIGVGWFERTRLSLREAGLSNEQVAGSMFFMLGLVPQMQREGDRYQRNVRIESYLLEGIKLTEGQVALVEEHARMIAAEIRAVSARVRVASSESNAETSVVDGGEGRPITYEEYVHVVAELRESVAAGMVTEEDARSLMKDMRRSLVGGWIESIPRGLAPLIPPDLEIGPVGKESPASEEPKARYATSDHTIT